MATAQAQALHPTVVSARLARLTPLTAAELEILQTAERDQRRAPARRELIGEGTAYPRTTSLGERLGLPSTNS